MVVSAILLTALAPITGALFGASYGTSIRIGYEIIFPALFGDMINDQKNKKSVSQEDGAKRTIKALHTMFTATGGASAMEFGIEQGIELAKKKTESPDVQNMIDLNLGLTEGQLRKKGRSGKSEQFQDPIKEEEIFEDVIDFQPTGDLGDFHNMSNSEIQKFFQQKEIRKNRFSFDPAFKLLTKEKGNTSFTRLIWKLRPKASLTTTEAIKKSGLSGTALKIAESFQTLKLWIKGTNSGSADKAQRAARAFLAEAKAYNRLVLGDRKFGRKYRINTTASLKAKRIITG